MCRRWLAGLSSGTAARKAFPGRLAPARPHTCSAASMLAATAPKYRSGGGIFQRLAASFLSLRPVPARIVTAGMLVAVPPSPRPSGAAWAPPGSGGLASSRPCSTYDRPALNTRRGSPACRNFVRTTLTGRITMPLVLNNTRITLDKMLAALARISWPPCWTRQPSSRHGFGLRTGSEVLSGARLGPSATGRPAVCRGRSGGAAPTIAWSSMATSPKPSSSNPARRFATGSV